MLNEDIVKLAEDVYIGTIYMPTREQIYQMAKLIVDWNIDRQATKNAMDAGEIPDKIPFDHNE